MEKLDLRKELKWLYSPSAKQPQVVEVPPMQFLMADGAIEPGSEPGSSPSFGAAVEAIYGMAYTLKFMSKQDEENPIDFPVMPLEGLWWVEDGQFDLRRKDNWSWRLLLMQPDHVTKAMFKHAAAVLREKKHPAALERVRLASLSEGTCVQVMHIGPYATEPETVDRLACFADEQGYVLQHRHHEIYLGDPRKAAPEKLKTIIRYPVRAKRAR